MTEPTPDRPPFDDRDTARAEAYLASTGCTSFDPFGPGQPGPDLILTTSLADARRMMAESFANRNAKGQAFRVLPVFVERSAPDAFAVAYEGLHICGVNIGLVSAVYELALFVFSQATMFRDIGDAAGEHSPVLPADAALSYWISDRLRVGEGAEGRAVGAELVPKDQQRQIAALFLTILMLRFVWLHELFHCLNGHAGYLAQRQQGEAALLETTDGAMLALVEIEVPDGPDMAVSDGYFMEFDADRSAYWATMMRQTADQEPIDGIRALPMMLRLRLTTFAAVLMTFLFDQAARQRRGNTSGSHPVAYDRLHNLVRTMASNLADPAGQIKQVFALTVVEMDRFKGYVPKAVSGAQLVRDLRSTELQREFDVIEDAVTVARSRFARLAFGHLL